MDTGVDLLLGRLGANGDKLAIHDGVMPEECTVAEVGRIVSPQGPLCGQRTSDLTAT
jgi:hypothetical protein